MTFVVAMTREASAADDRTWQMVTFEGRPEFEIGDFWKDPEDGLFWRIEDIFPKAPTQ